jgi:hypothetical protein
MSNSKTTDDLFIRGKGRVRELQSFIASLGARGLSKRQSRPIAKAYGKAVLEPEVKDEEFTTAWKSAWADLADDERETHFEDLIGVEKKQAEFLLYPYLPRAALTIMDGDPGMGKSLVTAQIGANITCGKKFANGEKPRKGRVLYLSPEDEPDRILRPRLEAHGADIAKIRFMQNAFILDEVGIEILRRELVEHPAELAIIDPLTAFIPENVNTHQAHETRGFMRPLAMLARDLDMSILVVRHMRKAATDSAIQAGQGSMDFIASVRSGLVVMKHPVDPETRVFAQSKANYSRKGTSITFEVVGFDEGSVPKIQWNGPIPQSADDLLQNQKQISAVERCAEAIKDLLAGDGMPARDALERLTKQGFSTRTITDAKALVGVKSGRGPGAGWMLG